MSKEESIELVVVNFCPRPLNKETIRKVNIEVLESNTLLEVLGLAIDEINSNYSKYGLKFNNNVSTSNMKIKLSKRTGLPDMDLPALTNSLTIKETSERFFSILVEESSISSIEQRGNTNSNNSFNSNSFETNSTKIEKFNINNNSKENSVKQIKTDRKGCCSIFNC